jgi:hypothetical protein
MAGQMERTMFLQSSEYARGPTLKMSRVPSNGVRYPRVGGTRQRRFAGTHSKPRKLLENAQTPTRRVHAVLARN